MPGTSPGAKRGWEVRREKYGPTGIRPKADRAAAARKNQSSTPSSLDRTAGYASKKRGRPKMTVESPAQLRDEIAKWERYVNYLDEALAEFAPSGLSRRNLRHRAALRRERAQTMKHITLLRERVSAASTRPTRKPPAK